MKRSLGIAGTSLIGMSLVAALALSSAKRPLDLPPAIYSGYDDIQYFPAGPENKLATQTAALKAAREAAKAAQRR
jgi:hypothetical protein